MKQSRNELIAELFENMSALKRGMHGQSQLLSRDCPISHAQIELLFAVRHNQPVSSKQLADYLHMTPGAVSQLVQSIEQHGYIECRTSDQDRRVQYLHVSPAGEKLIRGFEKNRRHMMESVIAELSDEELQLWLRVQQKMVAVLKTDVTK